MVASPVRVATWVCSSLGCSPPSRAGSGGGAGAGEAGVDGGEDPVVDGEFGEREEEDVVDGGLGALGFGVEAADGLYFVAEEVDADGAFLLGGVDVEDASAEGDLAGHFDDVDAGVANREEVLDEGVGEVLFASAEAEGEAVIEVAGEELHAGGFDGGDEEAGCGACFGGWFIAELPERGGAVLLNLGVGGDVFEGEDVVAGEAEDLVGGEGAGEVAGGEDGLVEGFSGLIVGNEDETRAVCCLDEAWQVKGTPSEGEAGDAAASCSGGKVAADALEGVGAFEVSKEFADEGEDHTCVSLAGLAKPSEAR